MAIVFSAEEIDGILVDHNEWLGQYIIRCTNELLGNKYAENVIKYPANWVEAFKDRWFPKWLIKRHPIKHEVRDAWLILPDYLKKFAIDMKERKSVNFYCTFEKPGQISAEDEEV